MNTIALLSLHYAPTIEYFCAIAFANETRINIAEPYQKQSFRNRCNILTANGIDTLSVPIIEPNKRLAMKDLKIDYKQAWVNRHWRAIQSAYGKSVYFEYYADIFRETYHKKPIFLLDLNTEILTNCLNLLKIKKNKILFVEKFEKQENSCFFDTTRYINPKNNFSENKIYQPIAYRQNFGNEFVPNLSVLDLLFCQGNQATQIIMNSTILNISEFKSVIFQYKAPNNNLI